MKIRARSFFAVRLISLSAVFASCDKSVSPAPQRTVSSTPAAEESQKQILQAQRERKSVKVGFNAGANDGIQCVGLAEYRHCVARVPSREKFDRRIDRALADVQKSQANLDASSFRSGYTAGFKAVLADYSRDRNSAW
ncbi:MAG: hypothetical protein QOH24_2166 [Verrucomicrobiota bacterium]|jgi:hypothetical protein